MTNALHHLSKRLMETTMIICLIISITLVPFGITADAKQALLSGDYINDTVFVAKSLKDTIEAPADPERLKEDKDTAEALINEYISKYRPKRQVNQLDSFTTMQTALNSLAGHYKTFENRPLPEKLKDRLRQELTKAEDSVSSGR